MAYLEAAPSAKVGSRLRSRPIARRYAASPSSPLTIYLELGDYCEIAAELLGTTPQQIARLPRIALADSVLSAPRQALAVRTHFQRLRISNACREGGGPGRASGSQSSAAGRQQASRISLRVAAPRSQRPTVRWGRCRHGRPDGGEDRGRRSDPQRNHPMAGESYLTNRLSACRRTLNRKPAPARNNALSRSSHALTPSAIERAIVLNQSRPLDVGSRRTPQRARRRRLDVSRHTEIMLDPGSPGGRVDLPCRG